MKSDKLDQYAIIKMKIPTTLSNILRENIIVFKSARSFIMLMFLWLFFAIPVQSQGVLASGKVSVWAVPAEQKVRPNDKPEINNLIWPERRKKLLLPELVMSMFLSRW